MMRSDSETDFDENVKLSDLQEKKPRRGSKSEDHSSLPRISIQEKKYENEEEKIFTRKLYKFLADKGQPILKVPSLGFQDLNLYKLYDIVVSRGGMDQVTKNQEWKAVYLALGLKTMSTSASYNTRTNYKKYLYLYELEHFRPFEGNKKADYVFEIDQPVKIYSQIQGATFYAKVVQRRVTEDGLNSYYVHYKGWSTSHDEWMPEGILEALNEEEQKHPEKLLNPAATRSSKSNYLIEESLSSTGAASSSEKKLKKKRKLYKPASSSEAGYSSATKKRQREKALLEEDSDGLSSEDSYYDDQEEDIVDDANLKRDEESVSRVATLLKLEEQESMMRTLGLKDNYYQSASTTDEEDAVDALIPESIAHPSSELLEAVHLLNADKKIPVVVTKDGRQGDPSTDAIKHDESEHEINRDIEESSFGSLQFETTTEPTTPTFDPLALRKSSRTRKASLPFDSMAPIAIPEFNRPTRPARTSDSNLNTAKPVVPVQVVPNYKRERTKEFQERELLSSLPLKGNVDKLPKIDRYSTHLAYFWDSSSEEASQALSAFQDTEDVHITEDSVANLETVAWLKAFKDVKLQKSNHPALDQGMMNKIRWGASISNLKRRALPTPKIDIPVSSKRQRLEEIKREYAKLMSSKNMIDSPTSGDDTLGNTSPLMDTDSSGIVASSRNPRLVRIRSPTDPNVAKLTARVSTRRA